VIYGYCPGSGKTAGRRHVNGMGYRVEVWRGQAKSPKENRRNRVESDAQQTDTGLVLGVGSPSHRKELRWIIDGTRYIRHPRSQHVGWGKNGVEIRKVRDDPRRCGTI